MVKNIQNLLALLDEVLIVHIIFNSAINKPIQEYFQTSSDSGNNNYSIRNNCIWIGNTLNIKEEGAGFTLIGWRFLICGIVSIIFAYVAKYFVSMSSYTRYILRQVRYKEIQGKTNLMIGINHKDYYPITVFLYT